MRYLLIITALTIAMLYATSEAKAAPSAYCNPERSKPCGKGCISLAKTCRTPWTTAVSGIRPSSSNKPAYDNPKYVEQAPNDKKVGN